MSEADSEFWTGDDKYHELAREFERNIELHHPKEAVSCTACPVIHCGWCATAVKYYRHSP